VEVAEAISQIQQVDLHKTAEETVLVELVLVQTALTEKAAEAAEWVKTDPLLMVLVVQVL
jgi:hypothetical protein